MKFAHMKKRTIGKSVYKEYAYYLLYLLYCLLNNTKPSREQINKLNISVLAKIANTHSLTAMTAYALESVGLKEKTFEEAKYLSIRKNIVLDTERSKIITELEKQKIWYCVLKGCIIKDWYPVSGMRQMADNDILVDENKSVVVKKIMEELGFTTVLFQKGHQDVYHKLPIYNFEMHSRLFEPRHDSRLYSYYCNIQSKLIKDSGNKYGYHFSDEDFYIYYVAHEYKHFIGAGTGLRSLVDTYVILRHFENKLDWKYIYKELNILGIDGFESDNRRLAIDLFTGNRLSVEQKHMLDRYIFSGTYGNFETRLNNSNVGKSVVSKIKYILGRLSISEQTLKEFYPFFYKYKIFRPILYIEKLVNKYISNKTALVTEIKEIIKHR